MRYSAFITYFTLSCFILFLVCFGTTSDYTTTSVTKGESRFIPSDFVEHPAILIEYESNFTDYGFSGAGTKESPYRLEGINITSTEHCIVIQNTESYFELVNCIFKENDTNMPFSTTIGVFPINVRNGLIENCTFIGKNQGYHSSNSYNCNVTDCSFLLTQDRAIGCTGGGNATISNCEIDCTNYPSNGVVIDGGSLDVAIINCRFYSDTDFSGSNGVQMSSENCTVENCTFYEWGFGAMYWTCSYTNLTNCRFYDCITGAMIYQWAYRNSISSNYIRSNDFGGMGIVVRDSCSLNEIANNDIIVPLAGIALSDIAINTTITNNSIRYGSEGILVLNSSWNNTITQNSVYLNSIGISIHSDTILDNYLYNNSLGWNSFQNAWSDSGANFWNTTIGNTWSNYSGVGTHPIPGSANDIDHHPNQMTDTIEPVIDSPSDLIIESGNIGYTVTWDADDLYPDTYEVWENDSVIYTGRWMGGIIEYDLSPLHYGLWNYTIAVYDGAGNRAEDTVFVNAIDTTSPIIDSPVDFSYEGGSSSNWINWTPSDFNPSAYHVELETGFFEDGSWSGGRINVSIDGLSLGVHTFTLHVNDSVGLEATDTVIVNVIDTTLPTVSDEADLSFESGTSGNWINWSIFDLYPENYQILHNGTTSDPTSWTSGEIDYNIDYLIPGIHNLTLQVYDTSGNWYADEVIVRVNDTIAPTISDLDYFVLHHGLQASLTWTAYDYNPDIYIIYLNDSIYLQSEWFGSDLTINFFNIDVGVYNLTIVLYDVVGQSCSDKIVLKVIDKTKPILSSPADLELEEGDLTVSVTWSINEAYPYWYVLYVDGSAIEDGPCDFATFTFSLDVLSAGVHNITLSITDEYANTASDSLTVTVDASAAPTVSGPSDITFELGSNDNWIDWACHDENPSRYLIERDGHIIASGSWDGSNISMNIDFLPVGMHNLSLTVFDTGNRDASHVVIVTVLEIDTTTTTTSITTTIPDTTTTTPSNFTEIFGAMLAPFIIGMIILGIVSSVSLVATIFLVWKYVLKKD
ncbi:MAG: right-handed parallel beta-helix repeat-containing protein [Candidatus Thorarchaeota archaeon]|nr:right-handed parallel beta-helix repeat-containing protein [Candidatus Thorarchaeota archaeon]